MKPAIWALGLLALVLVAYLPVLEAGYVYEDWRQLQQLGQPVGWTSRSLSVWAWTLTPSARAGHLLSLGLHLSVGALLWAMLRQLSISRLTSWIAVLVFLRHPLTVESVAYLSARTELLAAFGVLSACLVAMQGARWWSVPAVSLCALIALGGKESAVVLCALLPLTLWAVKSEWTELVAWAGALGLIVGVIVAGGPLRVLNFADYYQISGLEWLLAQSAAAHRLLTATLWPANLTVDPDIDAIPQAYRYLSVGLLSALGMLAYRLRQTRPLVTFGLTWALIAILPRLFVQTPRGYFNDHQWYLPLIGLTIAAAAWWDDPQGRQASA